MSLSFRPEIPRSAAPSRMGHATITYKEARSILTRTSGFLADYDYSLNPYAGCAFGCTYCYAAFFARAPEERDTWGYWVRVKANAAAILKKHRLGSLNGKRIYMSSVTDPYQPVERKLRLTRALLAILSERHAPRLAVQTRSADVVRDIDLFCALKARGGAVCVNMTVTTDDEEIRRAFEPYCSDNRRRLAAASAVHAAGIDTRITLTPLLLVSDANRFADQLLDTGVTRFAIQAFQFGGGRFVASTRQEAQRIMASRLGCSLRSFRQQYQAHYEAVRGRLRTRLGPLAQLLEDRAGFAPPA